MLQVQGWGGKNHHPHIAAPRPLFPLVLLYPLESFYMLWPLGNLDLYVNFSVPNLRFAPFSFNVKTNLGKLTFTEPDSEVDFALIGRFKWSSDS